ncbi:MAG: 3-dehydroquinate synthase [Sphaerochaetaceae bacterium]|nr:3-dehydroquinate synthase [Sphaerochaetaceae bacterium]
METLFKYGKAVYKTVDNFNELSYEIGNFGNNVLWICDTNTARMVRPLPQPNVIINTGEGSKNFTTLERILQVAIDADLNKNSTFIGLGGGVVCDITALAASIFRRGCKCLLIPTTIMAMGDACLGGKTGINFRGVKNAIGNTYEANEVLLCPEMLRSLPDREYYSGLSEIIKHALLSNSRELYQKVVLDRQKINARDLDTVSDLIRLSLETKKEVLEQNRSEILKLGHVFGTVLETMTDFNKSHGECIVWGIIRSTELGYKCGLCEKSFADNICRVFKPFKYDVDYKIPRTNWQLFKSILAKNNTYNSSNHELLILTDLGTVVSYAAEEDAIQDAVIESVVYR